MAAQPEPTPPWGRQPGESEPAYEAFKAFRDAGPGRTLDGAAAIVGKSKQLMARWSAAHEWVDRVRLWTNHEAAVEQGARDVAIASTAADWQRRRVQVCERLFSLHGRLCARAEEMLSVPLDDASWTLATAVGMSKAASDIGFLSIDVALTEDDAFDPLTATPEQCAEWVRKFHPKARNRPAADD